MAMYTVGLWAMRIKVQYFSCRFKRHL
jgi:hypothetical protein